MEMSGAPDRAGTGPDQRSPDQRRQAIAAHVDELKSCQLCPRMHRPPVTGRPVPSRVMLVGQAPGDKEPKLGRPFAWTAGKTLFRWFEQTIGLDEETFRSSVYMAAVCRCFPGKKETGGDRVPDEEEIARCRPWLEREIELLRPALVLPVGKLAISQFIPCERLDGIIGRTFPGEMGGHRFDLIPLPHPSGASTWHRREPGKTLLEQALRQIAHHPGYSLRRVDRQTGLGDKFGDASPI
jgi:uracil-DNA glycosylase